MSVARGFGINGKSYYTNICKPIDVNLQFTVDADNVNGLGIRSLKSNGYVRNVFMNTSATPGSNLGALNPNPSPGLVLIQLNNNFNKYIGEFTSFQSPNSGTPLTATVIGGAYTITALGTATAAQWLAAGVPRGVTPAVGVSFIAIASATIGGAAEVQVPATSGVLGVEVVGDPNLSLNNAHIEPNGGAYILMQMLSGSAPASAMGPAGPEAPDLDSADSFALLAGTTFTNVGAGTVVTGDAGATTFVAFPPGTLIGTQHTGDAAYTAALVDMAAAQADLASRPYNQDLSGIDLGGLVLTPGVYFFSSSAGLTGTLTLDAQGNPNATWIFQIGTTYITAPGSSVVMINGGQPGRVWWNVGSSVTLDTTTQNVGNLLAQVAITMNNGANNLGRALAQTAAVTMSGTSLLTIQSTAPTPAESEAVTTAPAAPAEETIVNMTLRFDGSSVTVDGL